MALAQSYTFRDAKGQTSTTRLFLKSDLGDAYDDGLALGNALNAITNAALQSAKGLFTTTPSGTSYGTTAIYEDVEDKAILTFTTASGGIHRYRVPAPVQGIFLADQRTVNPANTDVAALVTAMLATVCDRDGTALTTFLGGLRGAGPQQRRVNIYWKNPALSGPGL